MTATTAPVPRDRPRPSAAGAGSGRESLGSVARPLNDPPEFRTSSRGDAEHIKGAHTVALWSRRTARAIETMRLEDVAHGALSATEAAELIARV